MQPFPTVSDQLRRRRRAAAVDVRRIDDTVYDFRLRLRIKKDTWLVGLQQLLLLYNLKYSQTKYTFALI